MAVIHQGGSNPNAGKVTTTMGLREKRAPVCNKCRERKDGQIYSRDPNGNFVCEDCANSRQRAMLKDTHVADQG